MGRGEQIQPTRMREEIKGDGEGGLDSEANARMEVV